MTRFESVEAFNQTINHWCANFGGFILNFVHYILFLWNQISAIN